MDRPTSVINFNPIYVFPSLCLSPPPWARARCENIMTCPMKEIGSGSDHCPYDWLAVYDGRDEHAPPIGKFCGMGKFPFSIIGKRVQLSAGISGKSVAYFVRFVSICINKTKSCHFPENHSSATFST